MLHICARDEDCHHITPLDGEILEMMIAGVPNKLIGAELSLAPQTVKNRLVHLREAVGARGTSRIEFAWTARRVLHPEWNDPTQGIQSRLRSMMPQHRRPPQQLRQAG